MVKQIRKKLPSKGANPARAIAAAIQSDLKKRGSNNAGGIEVLVTENARPVARGLIAPESVDKLKRVKGIPNQNDIISLTRVEKYR